MPRRPLFAACGLALLLASIAVTARAQETGAAEPSTASPPASSPSLDADAGAGTAAGAESSPAEASAVPEDDLFTKTVALDIASADYYALVSWARSLGLSDAGKAEELRAALYAYYGVSAPPAAEASTKTITIRFADRTEYVAAKDGAESSVRFSGRVSLEVKDDDSGETLTIDADEIVVNRDANILSARGDIVFERKKADGSEFFMGDVLELDMDDWSGAFLDGQSSQGAKEGTSSLNFSADDIIKRGSDVLVFKDGVVSSCDDDHPHYSIRASTIWILGGNEWAMKDLTLSVGEIPLLYLPFFYYPGEEIAFHPVFGYDERFGRYVQTSTYLLGEKPPKEQEISLLKIAEGASGYERKVDGVFLRTTREKKASSTSDFFKIFVDLYSNIGGFAAAQAQVAALGPFKSVVGFAGIGLTRSVFTASDGSYTPFVSAADYASVWNTVDLLGTELPFRFGWELSSSVDAGPVKVAFSFPFYSDAYYNRDFKDRTEDMNWLQFLDQEKDETTISKISSFTDSLSVSGSLPQAMLPSLLSTVSLTRLATTLAWSPITKATPADTTLKALFAVDPSREFFVPYEWTLMDVSASVSGTLLQDPPKPKPTTTAAAAPAGGASAIAGAPDASAAAGVSPDGAPGALEQETVPVDAIGELVAKLPEFQTPWTDEEKAEAVGSIELPGFSPPPLASPEQETERVPFSSSLAWSWTPTFSWKWRFLTAAWAEPAKVDWSALYETRTVRNAGTLTLASRLFDDLLDLTVGVSASSQYQDRPTVSGDAAYASASLRTTWALSDAQFRNDKVSSTLKLSSSPFQDLWLWSPTKIEYSLASLLYEYAYESMNADYTGNYETTWADWTKDTVSAHALSVALGMKPWGYAQTVTLAANLPPILEGYTGAMSLKSPWSALTLGTAFKRPAEGSELTWDPMSATLTLGSSPLPTLNASFIWDIETNLPKTLSATAAWSGLSASLSATKAVAYTLSSGSGWTSTGDAAFRVSAASMSVKESWKPPAVWRKRIDWSLDVDSSAQQSFLRFTDSYLNVVLSLKLNVTDFFNLTFSSTSKNSSLWRYYPDAFELPSSVDIDAIRVNPLEDLIKSFDFFDATGANRRDSLFKLKALSITATHLLHDWDLSFTFSAKPLLNEATLLYSFNTAFTVSLAWRSVSQIKASYKKDGETVTWD